MAGTFSFEHRIAFRPEDADAILRAVPAEPGVFALRSHRAEDEPYLTRAGDMRRRMRRLLASPEALDEQGRPVLSKRLNLRERVAWIEWTATGSEFESALVVYCATKAVFGPEQARKRLRLHAPYMLRLTVNHAHPRVYSTNRLSARSLDETFGPFPSRAAAERYCDAVLDLFKLRRCWEDLEVSPEHPGCAYGEMKKCMEPCKAACSTEAYADETAAVRAFFATSGESMLAVVAAARDRASEEMDFEKAAELHKQYEKVKAAAGLADELVRPVRQLRAVVLQRLSRSASQQVSGEDRPETADEPASVPLIQSEAAAVFLLEHGQIVGPERLSTLGVRAVREQTAVGSSLFAQPLMLAAVPLEEAGQKVSESTSQLSPEDRARGVLARLEAEARDEGAPDIAVLCDFLALFRRWYYRPEKQRAGEVFLPNADGSWPVRRILNGAARVVLGPPKELPPVDREAAAELKTKVIHAGREGVERVVPVLPKRPRAKKKTLNPQDVLREEEV